MERGDGGGDSERRRLESVPDCFRVGRGAPGRAMSESDGPRPVRWRCGWGYTSKAACLGLDAMARRAGAGRGGRRQRGGSATGIRGADAERGARDRTLVWPDAKGGRACWGEGEWAWGQAHAHARPWKGVARSPESPRAASGPASGRRIVALSRGSGRGGTAWCVPNRPARAQVGPQYIYI